MKKENTKDIIAKQKKRTRVMCYISLFFLVVLLFLPPVLRIFVKDKEPEVVNVVTILSCNKTNETISSTFLNGEPQNILYKVNGNYVNLEENTPDENLNITVADNQVINASEYPFMQFVKSFSDISFIGTENVTDFRVNMNTLKTMNNYQTDFSNINVQEAYFATLGFTCAKTTR